MIYALFFLNITQHQAFKNLDLRAVGRGGGDVGGLGRPPPLFGGKF